MNFKLNIIHGNRVDIGYKIILYQNRGVSIHAYIQLGLAIPKPLSRWEMALKKLLYLVHIAKSLQSSCPLCCILNALQQAR